MKTNVNTTAQHYSRGQVFTLTLLRIFVGWHFLYEGLVEIYVPGWTAKEYLLGSVGPFSPLFKAMAQNETILASVDVLNKWGLVLIGFSLFAGLLSKPAKIAGIVLLAFYYLAYPPFAGLGIYSHVEGSYWVVNKNLIEMAALLVLLLFPSSHITGIDRFIFREKHIIW